MLHQGFDFSTDKPHAGQPCLTIFDQHLVNQVDEIWRYNRKPRSQIRHRIVENSSKGSGDVWTRKRPFASKHLKQEHAKGPDVSPCIQWFSLAGFRAEVINGADEGPCLRQTLALLDTGRTKITKPGRAICGQQHVAGLDVTVDDVQPVRPGQRIGQIQRNVQSVRDAKPFLFFQQFMQRAPADVLHDQIVLVVFLNSGQ